MTITGPPLAICSRNFGITLPALPTGDVIEEGFFPRLTDLGKYYSRSFTKGYRSWPSVADLDRQETTQSDDRGLTRAGTTRM